MPKTGKQAMFEYFYNVPENNKISQETLDETKELLEEGKFDSSLLCPWMLGLHKYEKRGLCYREENVKSELVSEDICDRCWKMFLKMSIE